MRGREWVFWFFLAGLIGLTDEVWIAWLWNTLAGSVPWHYPNSPWGIVDPMTFWCWGIAGLFWGWVTKQIMDNRYIEIFIMGCTLGVVLEWMLGYFFDLAGYTLHIYPNSPWIYFAPLLVPTHGIVAVAYAWIFRKVFNYG